MVLAWVLVTAMSRRVPALRVAVGLGAGGDGDGGGEGSGADVFEHGDVAGILVYDDDVGIAVEVEVNGCDGARVGAAGVEVYGAGE